MNTVNKNVNKNISTWLDTEFNHIIHPPRYFLKYNNIDDYYKTNDKHFKLNDRRKIKQLRNFSKFINKTSNPKYNCENDKIFHKKLIIESNLVQNFEKPNGEEYYQFLNPKTPRYHTNMLFNLLIDYCIKNELFDDKDVPIINKSMRNAFYKFCFENSLINLKE